MNDASRSRIVSRGLPPALRPAAQACDIGYFGASNSSFVESPDLQFHGMVTAGDYGFFGDFLRFERQAFVDEVGTPADYSVFAQGPGDMAQLNEQRTRLWPLQRFCALRCHDSQHV